MNNQMKFALLALVLSVVVAFWCWSWVFVPLPEIEPSQTPVRFQVDDTPLLTEAEKAAARETGYAVFDVDGVHYVCDIRNGGMEEYIY